MKTFHVRVVTFAVRQSFWLKCVFFLLLYVTYKGHTSSNNLLLIGGVAFLILAPLVWYFQRYHDSIYDDLYEKVYADRVNDSDDVRTKTVWACLLPPLIFTCFFWSMSLNHWFTDKDVTFSRNGKAVNGFTCFNPFTSEDIRVHGPPLKPALAVSTKSKSWKDTD